MICARPGCGQALTRRQIRHGAKACSRTCSGLLARRHPTEGRPTHCRVCQTPLTWAQARDGEHCSLSCVMRTRHGRPAPSRTTCLACGGPLTRRQQWRRRTWCSKSCAKTTQYAARPEVLAYGQARLRTVSRARFVARLRAFLLACPSTLDAGRKGWRNGWSAARRKALGIWHRGDRGVHSRAAGAALVRQIAETAPSKAEAFRRCYEAAWAACWRVYHTRRAAA